MPGVFFEFYGHYIGRCSLISRFPVLCPICCAVEENLIWSANLIIVYYISGSFDEMV